MISFISTESNTLFGKCMRTYACEGNVRVCIRKIYVDKEIHLPVCHWEERPFHQSSKLEQLQKMMKVTF